MEMNQLIGCQKNITFILVFTTPTLKNSVFSQITENIKFLKKLGYCTIKHDKNFFENIVKSA